jgi:hypothetical protein
MAGVAGLRSTADWGTDERPKNFREGVLRYNPSGTAPIFALSSQAQRKSKSTNDPEFSWWSEGNVITRLQVNGTHAATDTLINVDSVDPSAANFAANRGTATNLKNGDILLVEPTADNATFNHELVEVEGVLSDGQFNVRRGAGGTTAATIADNVWLLLISSAYAEGTGVPQATSRNPIKQSNYTQIFKDTYELTGTADKTFTRTGPAWSEDKKRKMWDHSQKIEWSILFGRPAETTGVNGKPKRFMGGIRYFLPSTNVTVFSGAVTPASFLAAVAPVFEFESTGAGETRMAFAGIGAIMELSKVFQNVANGFNFFGNSRDNTVKVFGYDFMEFHTPNGKIMIKSHPLLSRHPLYRNSMFIIDFDALSYVPMKDRDTKSFDDVQNKDEDLRRGYVQTEASIEVHFGGLTMAYLGNISAT